MSSVEDLYYVKLEEIDNGVRVEIPKNVFTDWPEQEIEYISEDDHVLVRHKNGEDFINVDKKYHYAAIVMSLSSQFFPRKLEFDDIRCFSKKGRKVKKIPMKKSRESSRFLNKIQEGKMTMEDLEKYDFLDDCSVVY